MEEKSAGRFSREPSGKRNRTKSYSSVEKRRMAPRAGIEPLPKMNYFQEFSANDRPGYSHFYSHQCGLGSPPVSGRGRVR